MQNNTLTGQDDVMNRSAISFLTFSSYLLMTAYAFSVTMIGPLMPLIINHYQLTLSQGGLVVTYQNIGGVLAVVISAILADMIKKHTIIIIGFTFYILALYTASFAPAYGILLLVFFGIGIARIIDTVLNAYISDIYVERRTVFLNLLHTFFGVGALLGPLYVHFIIDNSGLWNTTFSYLAIACAVLLVLFTVLIKTVPLEIQLKKRIQIKDLNNILKSSKMWLVCIIIFFYIGHASGLSVWLPMYMEFYLNTSVFLSSLALSILWIGIILGRLIVTILTGSFSKRQIILWGSIVGGLVLGLGFALQSPLVLLVVIGITGLVTGAIIPLSISIACHWYPDNSGMASSMIFFSASISGMIFPWLIGSVAEKFNFQWAIMITVFMLWCLFLTALFIPKE